MRQYYFSLAKVKGLKIGRKSNFLLIIFLFQYYAYLTYYNFIFVKYVYDIYIMPTLKMNEQNIDI